MFTDGYQQKNRNNEFSWNAKDKFLGRDTEFPRDSKVVLTLLCGGFL